MSTYETLVDLIEETLPDAAHDVEQSTADLLAMVLWDHGYRVRSDLTNELLADAFEQGRRSYVTDPNPFEHEPSDAGGAE